MKTILDFPSSQAAWGFAVQAREMGHHVRVDGTVNLFAPRTHALTWGLAVAGGAALGLVGAFAETFQLGLPRLGPIFAAPTGAPTVLFGAAGGSLGALAGGLLALRPAREFEAGSPVARVRAEGEREMLERMAAGWGGRVVDEHATSSGPAEPAPPARTEERAAGTEEPNSAPGARGRRSQGRTP